MADTKTEWYFIVNPRAGSGKTMSEWVPAEHLLDRLGIPYVTALTDHRRHATSLALEAAADGYRKIAAVGGDGSLHEVFNGICSWCAKTGTPTEDFFLAVVPIGSGNDWIKSLGVPNDVEDVVELIHKRSFGKMDVVKATSVAGKVSYMANIGGIGFDSHVCKRVNMQKESGMRGKMIYLNSLRYTLFNIGPVDICLIADGVKIFEGPCYSIAFGNGKYSGSGMRQVPLAVIDDGRLDYMIVPKAPLPSILRQIPRLFNATIYESKLIISGQCRSLNVFPNNEASNDIIELDGEIEGRIPLQLDITGHKINVLKG